MKKINKVFSLVMVLTLAACTFFSTAAFASTKIDGYKGLIGIYGGGGDVLKKGMSFDLAVASSAYNEDISKLHVVWSVSDSSAISIKTLGYDASNYAFPAKVQLLKGGVSPTVYATVNGIELSRTFNVDSDPVKATSVALGNNAVALSGKGKTAKVSITVSPDNVPLVSGDANPTVTSGNSHIATVTYSHLVTGEEFFTVTGVANGTTTIYVKTASGPSASCLVTVTGAGTPATVTTPVSTSKPSATTSKPVVISKPTTTESKPVTSSTSIISKPGSGASSSPTSTISAVSSAPTASSTESVVSSQVAVPQYTVSDSSEASTVSETSSAPDEQPKDNPVNVAVIVIIVIIVCGGAVALIVLRKRKIASGNMDDTQSIDISSKNKK